MNRIEISNPVMLIFLDHWQSKQLRSIHKLLSGLFAFVSRVSLRIRLYLECD